MGRLSESTMAEGKVDRMVAKSVALTVAALEPLSADMMAAAMASVMVEWRAAK